MSSEELKTWERRCHLAPSILNGPFGVIRVATSWKVSAVMPPNKVSFKRLLGSMYILSAPTFRGFLIIDLLSSLFSSVSGRLRGFLATCEVENLSLSATLSATNDNSVPMEFPAQKC